MGNCMFKHSCLIVTEPIPKDTELFVHYGTSYDRGHYGWTAVQLQEHEKAYISAGNHYNSLLELPLPTEFETNLNIIRRTLDRWLQIKLKARISTCDTTAAEFINGLNDRIVLHRLAYLAFCGAMVSDLEYIGDCVREDPLYNAAIVFLSEGGTSAAAVIILWRSTVYALDDPRRQ